MNTERIVKLTPEAIQELLDSRARADEPAPPRGRRRADRWAVPGTVEVWLPDECYGERHILATLHNLSQHGLALRTGRPIPTDTRISLAIHEPDLSCYGHGLVRHCTRAANSYLVGVEFIFYPDEEEDQEQF
jgi:hypothetical protein